MKKKIVMILLVTAMTVSVFAGCGNSVEGDGKVQAALANAGNGQEDSGGAAEGTEAGEPAPEAMAESTVQPTPEAAEPTVQSTSEATAEPTAEPAAEPTEESASTAEPEKDTESGTTADSSQGAAANNSVNSQTAQQGTNQPFQQTGTNQTNTAGTNGTEASANDTAASSVPDWFDPVFYAKEYPDVAAVMGTDAGVLYRHYLNYGKAEGRKFSANSNAAGTKASSTTTSNYLSQAFVNYLNQQRSAAGLNQIAWNSDLESHVLSRAQQISANFSHDGMTVGEIIQATGSTDPAEWFNTWYESDGHRLFMMDSYLTDGACGVFQAGDYYYVALQVMP